MTEDLAKIFKALDLNIPVDELDYINKLTHFIYLEYFDNSMFKNLIEK